jgi:hypothetical protein
VSEYNVGRYFTPGESGQQLSCLYRSGRTRLHIIVIESSGVIELTPKLDEAKFIKPLVHKGGAYPIDKAVRRFRSAGRTLGITSAAKAELDRAAS